MSLSCEKAVRYILPLYRAFVAKELIAKYNFTQIEAARKIGTTQAAISQYVTSKRGYRTIPNYDDVALIIQEAATQAAKRLATAAMSSEEFKDSFCEVCSLVSKAVKHHL